MSQKPVSAYVPQHKRKQEEGKKKKDVIDMDIEKTKKEEAEFAAVADKAIADNTALVKEGKTAEAIENLYLAEKQARQGGDATSTSRLAVAIISLIWEKQDFASLNTNLTTLAKRRGQLKQAVTAMVQKALSFVESLNEATQLPQKLELIATLRTITEGKIFVENERAKLTSILAQIKEKEGKIKEAAEILQEVQVETYGSMEKKEKTEYILEQMRLCLDANDFIRAQIISKKINPRVLNDENLQDAKLKFHNYMVRYYSNNGDYMAICKAYQAIYDTPSVKNKPEEWKHYLKLLAVYLALAPYDNEQSDFMNRIYQDKNIQELPAYRDLLKFFLTKELMNWPKVEALYKAELASIPAFSAKNEKLWSDFHKRVVEHNIRIVAGYYSRIHTARLAELLFLTHAETEKYISDLVVAKSIFAKIDRPAGIIDFVAKKAPADMLNEWSGNIASLLDLVDKTTHLIQRENMVHRIE